ncbi:CHAT domain-containing protein [Dietzia maris]|uniref:CHAT domain-containing protein n=1 Tax=Dietzia maris TaxID=37915 RepID=UPI0024908586|nr:CHAT domain-containing protein [Dietzia maris]
MTTRDVMQIGEPIVAKARRLLDSSVSTDSAAKAAALLGECYNMTRVFGLKPQEIETRSLLAHAIARMIVPNRDECRRYGSKLFSELAKEFLRMGDRKGAAIEYTNAALCLLELHDPTRQEILEATALCSKTLRMREKGSIDYAYSQLNLSLAERMALPISNEPDKRGAYAQMLKGLDRSRRVFLKHDATPAIYQSTYFANVVDTLKEWLRYEIRLATRDADASAFSRETSLSNPADLSAEQYCSALRANPRTVGYESVPDWVPTSAQVTEAAVERIEQLRPRLLEAETLVKNSNELNVTIKLKIFELKLILAPLDGDPSPPWDALNAIWNKGDWQLYFTYAARLIGGESVGKATDVERYKGLLRRASICLVLFRKTWTPLDVSRLLINNEMTFRMTACELGRFGEWEEAFKLLEYSRGLNSSRSWSEDPDQYLQDSDNASWAHVTHSPRASYVVLRRGDRYVGAEFMGLSGAYLSPLFSKLGGTDLVSPGSTGRRETLKATLEIESALLPVTTWLDEHSGDDLVLMPGGFYQSFPIWACGKLGDDLISHRRRITSVPSRTVALRNTKSSSGARASDDVRVVLGSDVSGFDPLPWCRNEGKLIEDALAGPLAVTIQDATVGSVISAFQMGDLFHFTGHSTASFDPKDSALVTYSGGVTVKEILNLNSHLSLAFFSSCESGLARNFQAQDEFLSLQTAAYYAGSKMAIGTTWAIKDTAAFFFASRFYGRLSELTRPSGNAVFETIVVDSYMHAIRDLKSATLSELRTLAIDYGIDAPVPDSPELAFTFLDWAAFGLVGVDSSGG